MTPGMKTFIDLRHPELSNLKPTRHLIRDEGNEIETRRVIYKNADQKYRVDVKYDYNKNKFGIVDFYKASM